MSLRIRTRPLWTGGWFLFMAGVCLLWTGAALGQSPRAPGASPGPFNPLPDLPPGEDVPEDEEPAEEAAEEDAAEEEEPDECEDLRTATAERLYAEYAKIIEECCPEEECPACEPCDWCRLGDPWTLNDCLWGCREPHCTIGGWTQWGYHSKRNGLFNNHPHRINNHQSYLYLEKAADGALGFDYGFRADLVYGVDAQDTQAFGEPPPQDHWDNPWDHGIYG
ncbi:MAG: outer membrane beta-barrel protein, partial [Planctomycetaceae bacterium]